MGTTDSNGRHTATLAVPASVTTGTAYDTHRLKGPIEIAFAAIGSSTHVVKVSYDGVSFTPVETIFADCIVAVDLSPRWVRVDTTVYASGSPTAILQADER